MVHSDNDYRNLNTPEEKETSIIALSYGEVFIVEDNPLEWWICCNNCKWKFDDLEKFLNHATNLHLKKQKNVIFKTGTEDLCSEDTNSNSVENEDIISPPSINNVEDDKINVINDENIRSRNANEIAVKDKETIESELNIKAKFNSISDLCLENSNLKIKTKGNENGERFPCPHCGKTYGTKRGQRKHIKTHFTIPEIFKCEVCDMKTTRKEYLRIHMRIHTGERPYKCKICPRTFRAANALDVHMMTHTGEKRFSCSFCEKPFRTKQAWTIHERTHTGEKPFQCDTCGDKFSSAGALMVHGRKHKEPGTIKKSNTRKKKKPLTHRKVISTKEKKFVCQICSKHFDKKGLQMHARVHAETNDYICNICNENFRTYYFITYHLKRKHGCFPAPNYNYTLRGGGD